MVSFLISGPFDRDARPARRCQRLEPTWEAMAEEVDASEDLEVDVAKVDCVANRNLCGAQRIQAFPTLRFFKDGKQYGLDYRQDRTVQALTAFLKQKVELEKTMEDGPPPVWKSTSASGASVER